MAVVHTEPEEFELIDLSESEYKAALTRALADLGLTYEQLAEQARRREFSSPDARSLRLRIKPL